MLASQCRGFDANLSQMKKTKTSSKISIDLYWYSAPVIKPLSAVLILLKGLR